MLVHQWFDQQDTDFQQAIRLSVLGAVQFDGGDVNALPWSRGIDFIDAEPPFPVTLLQFDTPTLKHYSHALILWEELDCDTARFIGAMRNRSNSRWMTISPRLVSRHGDDFHYKSELKAGEIENAAAIATLHAMAFRFFDVLACSNVATVSTPPSAALNKKRVKKGKLPILEYKTLTIVLDESRSESDPQGGTHASPRVHLRRGHIRRITPEKRVWVQPCVVGSKHGMIVKDYKVTTKASIEKERLRQV
jgi:hypothetical protein